MIEAYGKALKWGHTQVFHALPRMLTVWLDATECIAAVRSNHRLLEDLNGILRQYVEALPAYQWFTCVNMLISRFCHPAETVAAILLDIVAKVLCIYPRQSMWGVIAAMRSTDKPRQRKAKDAMKKARELAQCARFGVDEGRIIKDQGPLQDNFISLVDKLFSLSAQSTAKGVKTFRISTKFAGLARLRNVGVVIPTQRNFTVMLPPDGRTTKRHDGFAGEPALISHIVDDVTVMSSLQRPKKIAFMGSDGREYPFLLKPKDDLRKDARMMDLYSMLNRFLKADPESRRRNLVIRTYAVIPITEECGLIEWVSNLNTLRSILTDLYVKSKKYGENERKIIRVVEPLYGEMEKKSTPAAKVACYNDKIGSIFPPMLHMWYLRNFPEPNAWFDARLSYAHTLAVMSMVGYVVGLGDRHNENILLCAKTGDACHVDFNMLFEQGKTLSTPETVPFRLTPNMVDGLGVQGVEGVYKKSCEITMRLMRSKRDALMNVLETFVHDPLLEWQAGRDQVSRAREIMDQIKAKLNGLEGVQQRSGPGSASQKPLSVEGQVADLINQATDAANLSKMYIWWMPWW